MEEIRSRGGARPGAGRPKKENKRLFRVCLCITESEAALFERYHDKTGISPKDALRAMYESWLSSAAVLLKE